MLASPIPRTTIRMGASVFALKTTYGTQTAFMDLRRAPEKTIGKVARDVCALHGIKAKSTKRRAPVDRAPRQRKPASNQAPLVVMETM